jgi:hypothetical protein
MPTPRKPKELHKPPGRPSHVPTKATIAKVEDFLRAGFRHSVIAKYLQIDQDTFSKHYAEPIRLARLEFMGEGVSKLHLAVKKGEDWALRFLLQMQAHGKDFEHPWGNQTALTGAGGKDLFAGMELSRLTDEQYTQLKSILAAGGAAIPDSD